MATGFHSMMWVACMLRETKFMIFSGCIYIDCR
jgi:hypothetical protein